MEKPDVYVVIVTYNGMEWIDRCFGSIQASEMPLKTIVVDNGSTDGTVDKLRKDYPWTEIIETGRNLGFGKANNIGMKCALDAGCDYVYLLNQDAWIYPDTIERMVAIQRAEPEYFVLSPMQLTGDRTKHDPNFEAGLNEGNCKGYRRDLESGALREVYEITFVMAAHWLMSRRSLLEIGGFSPIFPHYGEDDNYLHRLRYHGFKAGVCPGIFGVHDRENRQMTGRDLIKRLYICYLVKACNINLKPEKAYLSAGWRVWRDGFAYVFRYRSLAPIDGIFRSMSSVFRVRATRRQTKHTNATFL